MIILAFFIIGLVICYLIINNYKRRSYILDKLNKQFGLKPENFKEDYNMDFVKEYYKARIENKEKSYSIDELTWNDLDMDSVFKRTNYTSTTLGEAYLYYKYRNISYDKEEWAKLESLIHIFTKNSTLRNSVKLNLMKVGKLNDKTLVNFIYNPSFNKINGYYKYPLLSICLLLSIALSFILTKIGVLLTISFLLINSLFYLKAKAYLEKSFNVVIYLINNINLCERLCKIKDKDFINYKNELESILSNFSKMNKVKLYYSSFHKDNGNIFTDLNIIAEYIKIFFMTDIISYERVVNFLEENEDNLCSIYDWIARLDFAISIAYYRASLDEYAIPEFTEYKVIELENLYHPLIDNPIKNSISIDKNIIFTGSNASGKSTFIKAIALNCIMSQSINTALCSKYKCIISKVITSMAVKDNILQGDSYFIAEIKSLKRLLDSLKSGIFVLAFIDEILKGTNTAERISASASILRYANKPNCRILVATHDMELTKIITTGCDNYHFRESFKDNNVIFDYKLRKGPSTTRNAIKLLEAMNFEKSIIYDANNIYNKIIEESN